MSNDLVTFRSSTDFCPKIEGKDNRQRESKIYWKGNGTDFLSVDSFSIKILNPILIVHVEII